MSCSVSSPGHLSPVLAPESQKAGTTRDWPGSGLTASACVRSIHSLHQHLPNMHGAPPWFRCLSSEGTDEKPFLREPTPLVWGARQATSPFEPCSTKAWKCPQPHFQGIYRACHESWPDNRGTPVAFAFPAFPPLCRVHHPRTPPFPATGSPVQLSMRPRTLVCANRGVRPSRPLSVDGILAELNILMATP